MTHITGREHLYVAKHDSTGNVLIGCFEGESTRAGRHLQTLQQALIKQSKSHAEKGPWKDALNDANEVARF